jgi:agmatine deiminase
MDRRHEAAVPTPLRDGFAWPAEWAQHRRTWICWPARHECFGGPEGALRAKQAYARVARAVSGFEPVTLAARPADAAEARLATGGGVDVVEIPLDDSWARDFGPTFLKGPNRRLGGVKWVFNAWGRKYHPYTNDAAFACRVLEATGATRYAAPLTAEGGALHTDGEGTVLTTEQCLLNPNRNPGLTLADIEDVLKHYVGARKAIWLGSGFSDDETDGHVDNIACFAAPGRVIVGIPPRTHPDFTPVQEALNRLRAARDAEGRSLEIIELPQPRKLRQSWSGQMLQASYVNFYLANGAVIMPGFGDQNDEPARLILAQCFPDRDVLQIDALDIVQGGGGIHCITQQEPIV